MSFGILAAMLALGAGLLYRSRLGKMTGRRPLSDDMIRRIEESGTIDVDDDEPLDMQHIREEEERFLEETTWDDPDE